MKSKIDILKLNVNISSVRETKGGSVIVKCNRESDNEKVMSELSKVLTNDCKVEMKSLRNPRI